MSVLAVEGLTVEYTTRHGRTFALDAASLEVAAGERVAIIGESGSGKTTLGLAVGRLLPPNATIVGGKVTVGGRDVTALSGEALRRLRSDELGFIFQDPLASLDPTKRVEKQLRFIATRTEAPDLRAPLRSVGLPDPDRVLRSFPHELSGGIAQRVAIAMALLRLPRLVIADEPTAALDAITRRRILELLVHASAVAGAAVLLFTHDLGAARAFCNRIVVMYGGRVVEDGMTEQVFGHPLHPYTRALLRAALENQSRRERLEPIPGAPLVLRSAGGGCAFVARCAYANSSCGAVRPLERELDGRLVVCHEAEMVLRQEVRNAV